MNLSTDSDTFSKAVHSAVLNAECNELLDSDMFNGFENCFLIGNGGSSSVASHIANDMVKVLKVPAHVLTDPALLTCMANDYGWENALREIVNRYVGENDALICISSSGESQNIIEAADVALVEIGAFVVTFSGFAQDNKLRSLGDVNYWVPSSNYGVVECAHLVLLHSIVNPGEIHGV